MKGGCGIVHPLSVKTTRSKPYFKRSFVYTLFPSTSILNIARSMLSQRKHYTMLHDGIIIDPFIKMNRSIFFKCTHGARASIFTLIFRCSSNIFFRLSPETCRLSSLPQLINDFQRDSVSADVMYISFASTAVANEFANLADFRLCIHELNTRAISSALSSR